MIRIKDCDLDHDLTLKGSLQRSRSLLSSPDRRAGEAVPAADPRGPAGGRDEPGERGHAQAEQHALRRHHRLLRGPGRAGRAEAARRTLPPHQGRWIFTILTGGPGQI